MLRLELIRLLLLDVDKFNMLAAFDGLVAFDASDRLSPALRGGSGGALCSSSERALVNTLTPDPDDADAITLELDADARTGCFNTFCRVVVVGSLLVSVILV